MLRRDNSIWQCITSLPSRISKLQVYLYQRYRETYINNHDCSAIRALLLFTEINLKYSKVVFLYFQFLLFRIVNEVFARRGLVSP